MPQRPRYRYRYAREDAGDTCEMIAGRPPLEWDPVPPAAVWEDKWACGECGQINGRDTFQCCMCGTITTSE